jgi:type VI secretion system secreted protein Hcp
VSLDAALASFGTATNYYLRIPNIPGDSAVNNHANDIDVQTFTWGMTNSAGTATGAKFTNLTITKFIDPASPLLMSAAAAGTSLGTIVLFAEKPGPSPFEYVRLTIGGAKVTSLKQTGDRASGILETVGLAYTKLTLRYAKQSQDGSIGTTIQRCWNLSTQQPC